MSDIHSVDDDPGERKAGQAARTAKAASSAPASAEDIAKALLAGRQAKDEEPPLPDIVRAKVRVQQKEGHAPFLTFAAGELADPQQAGAQFRFGATVYLKRAAFLIRKRDGSVIRGDV